MNLHTILQGNPTIEDIQAHLDVATPDARVEECFALGRSGQRRLFDVAGAAPGLGFDHFVPDGINDGQQVIHRGKNTLPLPKKHKLFEKRFCRPGDGSARLFGYNECASTRMVGPGYFVAIPTAGNATWTKRGAIVVDYFQVPETSEPLPSHWPRLVPNTKGLQRFVYNGTRDYMRRVSKHVSIGAAYKGERALDHYFVLVRQD